MTDYIVYTAQQLKDIADAAAGESEAQTLFDAAMISMHTAAQNHEYSIPFPTCDTEVVADLVKGLFEAQNYVVVGASHPYETVSWETPVEPEPPEE
jgi:hypothetical protein